MLDRENQLALAGSVILIGIEAIESDETTATADADGGGIES